MGPIAARRPDGSLSLLFVPRELATILLELPAILDDDTRPEVASLRYQDPTDDATTNAEWRRMMHAELVHLFGAARDVVAQDLALLERTFGHPGGARLDIPAQHVNAWISALQMARVSLAAIHGLDEEPDDVGNALTEPGERADAAWRIQALGELQALLLYESAPELESVGDDVGDDEADEGEEGEGGEEEDEEEEE